MSSSQKAEVASRRQARAQPDQPIAYPAQRSRVGGFLESELQLLRTLARLGEQALLGALQGEPLVVEQGADALDQLQVALSVHALPGRIFLRPQQLELGLPVTQDVGGDARARFDFADAIVQLLGGVGGHAGVGLLIRCLSPLLGLKVSTLRAVISMLSPVWGFRPRREALRRMRKC